MERVQDICNAHVDTRCRRCEHPIRQVAWGLWKVCKSHSAQRYGSFTLFIRTSRKCRHCGGPSWLVCSFDLTPPAPQYAWRTRPLSRKSTRLLSCRGSSAPTSARTNVASEKSTVSGKWGLVDLFRSTSLYSHLVEFSRSRELRPNRIVFVGVHYKHVRYRVQGSRSYITEK